MPLATLHQIYDELKIKQELLNQLRPHNPPLILDIQPSRDYFRLSYLDQRLFEDNPYDSNTPGIINHTVKTEQTLTRVSNGKTKKDYARNLFYHWITDFKHLNTLEKLRNAILDIEQCGSLALTIALNKYINRHHPTEEQIKHLLSKSKFRWIKTKPHRHDSGYSEYIQQTLYEQYDYSENYINILYQNQTVFPLHSLAGIMSFNSYLHGRITEITNEHLAQSTTLLAHSTKATETFKFKSNPKSTYKTFLGIELELEGFSPTEFQSLNILKKHAIFKKDGSLQNGVEICSAPATLDIHKEAFAPFFTALTKNKSKLIAKNTCGMHIHIDKLKLSTLHIANIYLLVNKPENRAQVTKLSGRNTNQFCQPHETGYRHFTTPLENNTKYRMVNLVPPNTIELRIFASTTNFDIFCKNLELAQALVDYTKPGFLNIPIPKIPLWENFSNYVKQHPKTYPTLSKEI